tara:strand:+ start:98 stop:781 length:684 start_codon:yes stop_codon:yes gene_type:complete
MANTSTAGYGLRAVMTVGSTPATSGQAEYQILGEGATTGSAVTSKTFFKGDTVSINDGTGAVAGQKGYIQDATYATTDDAGAGGADFTNAASPLLVGVFNGAYYVAASTSKPTWSNSFDNGTTVAVDYNTGTRKVCGFVMDNPNQEYNIRANDPWTQADVGTSFNTGSNGATGISGMSDERLDVNTAAAATSALTLLRNADIPDQKDQTVGGCDVVVIINKASALFN